MELVLGIQNKKGVDINSSSSSRFIFQTPVVGGRRGARAETGMLLGAHLVCASSKALGSPMQKFILK